MSIPKYKIYLDMDGVISDWVAQFKKYSGNISPDTYEKAYGPEKRYNFVYKRSPNFYANMSKMPDADVLLDFLKKYEVEILSYATDAEAAEGKLTWLKNNNIDYTPVLTDKREDKAKFAEPNSILIDDDIRNIEEFRNAGGIAIHHKDAISTINQLKQLESDLLKENKYRLYNSVLNPDIWNSDNTIKPEVERALLLIADSFYKDTELDVPLEDVLLLGSAAGYNWSPTSDLDIHLVVDFDKINKDSDLVSAYTNLLKAKWNMDHDIVVHNHPVEVYIQDLNHKTNSLGIYSLKNKKWIKEPSYSEPDIDKESIKKKYYELKSQIDSVINNKDSSKIKKLIEKLYAYRQSGLDKNGEFSTENIVFKLLRTKGYLDKLKNANVEVTDANLSSV